MRTLRAIAELIFCAFLTFAAFVGLVYIMLGVEGDAPSLLVMGCVHWFLVIVGIREGGER